MRVHPVRLVVAVAFVLVSSTAYAQSTVSTLNGTVSKGGGGSVFSIPVGGTLGLPANDANETGGAALFGIQYEKADTFLLSAIMNLGTGQTIKGAQSAFGAALVNPATDGRGFTGAATVAVPQLSRWGALFEVGGRVGVNGTNWERTVNGAPQTVSGGVIFFAPGVQIGTRSIEYKDDNYFRLTLSAAYSMRTLWGDLAQRSADAFRRDPGVLGVSDTSFNGAEIAILMTLNDVQPFVRYSHFSVSRDISGFSGNQIVFGVNALTALFKTER
jgi:hypothetical protein